MGLLGILKTAGKGIVKVGKFAWNHKKVIADGAEAAQRIGRSVHDMKQSYAENDDDRSYCMNEKGQTLTEQLQQTKTELFQLKCACDKKFRQMEEQSERVNEEIGSMKASLEEAINGLYGEIAEMSADLASFKAIVVRTLIWMGVVGVVGIVAAISLAILL